MRQDETSGHAEALRDLTRPSAQSSSSSGLVRISKNINEVVVFIM